MDSRGIMLCAEQEERVKRPETSQISGKTAKYGRRTADEGFYSDNYLIFSNSI